MWRLARCNVTDETKRQIDAAAEVLKRAGATAVYVFGSAAEGTDTADSDLDLAVSGLPPAGFFHAVGEATMAVARPIDVIDLDEPSAFTDYLERKGRLLRVA